MRGRTHLKQMLMTGTIAVASVLLLAPATSLARNGGSSGMSSTNATASGSVATQGKADANDMISRGSTTVTGNVAAQTSPDADDMARPKDRDDMKARAAADDQRKGTDRDDRRASATAGSTGERDRDDMANTSRSNRFNANSNGRFASDRDRGLDRAADRHERHFIQRASFRHHHHHIVLKDRDRNLDDMRTNDRDRDDLRTNDHDRDDMKSPSGH